MCRSIRASIALLVITTSSLACGNSTTGGTSAQSCVPGKVDACPCGDGNESTQTCTPEGIWGPCQGCPDGAASDVVDLDGAGMDGAGPADASPQDANAMDAASSLDVESPADAVDFGDGVLVTQDISSDVVATQSCTPCGYGVLKGLVCSPSEQIFVANAKVSLTFIDCDGKTKQISTYTDSEGAYLFPKIPCGKHKAVVTAGSFETSFNVNVKPGTVRDITGVGQKLCFKANAAKIAVFWGQWDHQHKLLDKLGFKYTWYNFEWEYFNDVNPKDIDAVKVLRNPAALSQFDIIFFNCGSAAQSYVHMFPDIAKNLKAFVLGGGSLYASDLSWAWIEGAFPNAIDFYGTNDLPSAPSNDGPQQVEGNQTAPATIIDPALAAYVGVSVFKSHYGPGPLVAVSGAGPGTTVHVNTVVQIKNLNKKGILDPDTVPYSGPAVLSSQPAPGAGRLLYTTFHNDEQADAVMLKLLHYLVFLL